MTFDTHPSLNMAEAQEDHLILLSVTHSPYSFNVVAHLLLTLATCVKLRRCKSSLMVFRLFYPLAAAAATAASTSLLPLIPVALCQIPPLVLIVSSQFYPNDDQCHDCPCPLNCNPSFPGRGGEKRRKTSQLTYKVLKPIDLGFHGSVPPLPEADLLRMINCCLVACRQCWTSYCSTFFCFTEATNVNSLPQNTHK